MRKLDGKFHLEGEKIIKTSNGEELDLEREPVILIRARDRLALPLLRIYRELSLVDNCTQYHLQGISKCLSDFATFRVNNPDKIKQPGITKGL